MALYRSLILSCSFQEDYLSTRAVIFINDQVYFSCRSHVFTEDVHEAPDLRADSTLLSSHMSKRFIRDNVQPSVLYLKCVETYTTRRLTHTEDILDAFSGAGKALGNLLSARMIYGLPNSIFDLALLWQPVGRSTRRKGFPSWSWAGWNEPVQWVGDTWGLSSFGYFATAEQERTFVTRWLRERTWIDWYCVSATGDLGPVWSATESKQSYYSRTSIGYDHAASSDINLFGRDNTSRDPILTNLVTPRDGTSIEITRPTQQSSLLKNEYFLYFSTLTAKFYIEPSDYYLRYGSIDPVWEPNGRTVFLLRSKTHQTCGYVLLQSDWRTKYSSDVPYDFLLLSEANYDCKWSRPHENHPYKKSYGLEPNWAEFHVMMVQQNPTLGGDSSGMVIVERVGIGRLLKEAMGDACEDGPRWKQILLG